MADDAREIVARAICDSMEADCFDDLHERSIMRAAYLQQADAAIAAMPIAEAVEALERARRGLSAVLGHPATDRGSLSYMTAYEAMENADATLAKLSRPV